MTHTTTLQQALSVCTSDFERQNVLAFHSLSKAKPESKQYSVTIRKPDGSGETHTVWGASLDAAVSLIRNYCHVEGIQYTGLESIAL